MRKQAVKEEPELQCPFYGDACVGPEACAPAVFNCKQAGDEPVCPIAQMTDVLTILSVAGLSHFQKLLDESDARPELPPALRNLKIDQSPDGTFAGIKKG